MLRRPALKDPRREHASFRARAWIGYAFILLALAGLLARFVWLQVVQHQEFVTRANANRIRLVYLPPPRGQIYDRNGVLLADNIPAYRLEVVPERVPHLQAMLQQLAQVVPLSAEDLRRFHDELAQHRPFQSVPLRLKLSEDEIARFAINQWRFPGVAVVPYLMRNYPQGKLFAHVLGYVGRIDASEQARLDPALYAGTLQIGKSGIERQYEDLLHGKPGYELVEVNVDQRPLRVLERVPPTPGRNLYLSIDARLQQAGEAAFAGRPGAAVAIDPRNGQVLALVSVPSYNPNLFVSGISDTDYRALLDDPDKPLLNRALRGLYPPGSTVKPYLALGGLELGLRTPQDTVDSTGEFYLPGQKRGYRDDQRGGVGRVAMVQAIEQSVNTYFYKLAVDMGIDRLAAWMGRFGFGRPSGIDLPAEASGVLPSPAWKRATFHQPWYLGETVIAGIGQGYWVVTPLQLAHALATLADHGVAHAPRLLLAEQSGMGAPRVPAPPAPATPSFATSAPDWNTVVQGMVAVVNGDKGTARGLDVGFPYPIAGKTGTAERYSRTTSSYDSHLTNAQLAERHRALFECFTPADDPRIAVVVVLEHGAWGGSAAAPIARKILDAWARERGLPDTPLTEAPPG